VKLPKSVVVDVGVTVGVLVGVSLTVGVGVSTGVPVGVGVMKGSSDTEKIISTSVETWIGNGDPLHVGVNETPTFDSDVIG
jgi:hypothetical protein